MLKNIRNSFVAIVVVATSFSSIQVANAADAANGEKLSQTCLGCHGVPGLRNPGPVFAVPMIGGQHAEYIISALKAYRDKTRSHKTMQAQASNLTDEAMVDIAAFFAQMEGNSRPSLVSEAESKMGQKASASCAACHGKTGDGAQSAFPKLAGQYESYLIQALKDYRSNDRQNMIMSGQATNLSIAEIKVLSAWFSSQDGGLSAPEATIFK
ncbi:MAG: cytochrome c553 [Arenicella sp.]|jgi:cytochrome c553